MSAFSISEPFPTFHDRDGQPLENGYVYIGVAASDPTTNPITVYWDPALTITASQPIRTLNGYPSRNGAPARLFVDASDYSITVNDSDNTLVYTSANATIRIPGAALTGTVSSDNVSYLNGATNSTVRTLTSKLQESVSIFDFLTPAQIAAVKAKTFLVDVTAAIASALASPAQEIYFPEGGYLVNGGAPGVAGVNIFSGTNGRTLRGAGGEASIIRNTGTGAAIACNGTAIAFNTGIVIRDLAIQNAAAGTLTGIAFTYTKASQIERVKVSTTSPLTGADGVKLTNCESITLSDVWAPTNELGAGVNVGSDCAHITVLGGLFEGCQNGIKVAKDGGTNAPFGVTIVGARCRGNSNFNAWVGESQNVRFFGCYFDTAAPAVTATHIRIDGNAGFAVGAVVDGCTFSGNNNTNTINGIIIERATQPVVQNSNVNCTGSVALATLSANVTSARLRDNTLTGTVTFAGGVTSGQCLTDTITSYTVATLPSYATNGTLAFVTDALSAALVNGNSIGAGGGTARYLVMYRAAGWVVIV